VWYAEFLDSLGAKFLNVNELEFSETNLRAVLERGYKPVSDESAAIKGSLELGLELLKWGEENTSLSYHLCTAKLKDAVQLKNRLRRMARNVARPYMEVTEDGTLRFGIAEYDDLDGLYEFLVEEAGVRVALHQPGAGQGGDASGGCGGARGSGGGRREVLHC